MDGDFLIVARFGSDRSPIFQSVPPYWARPEPYTYEGYPLIGSILCALPRLRQLSRETVRIVQPFIQK